MGDTMLTKESEMAMPLVYLNLSLAASISGIAYLSATFAHLIFIGRYFTAAWWSPFLPSAIVGATSVAGGGEISCPNFKRV